jgi:hypothetical protein
VIETASKDKENDNVTVDYLNRLLEAYKDKSLVQEEKIVC